MLEMSKMFEKNLKKNIKKLEEIPKGDEYDEVSIPLYNHKNFLVKKLFLDRFFAAYKMADFKNKVVLDYGCGSGLFLQSLSSEIKNGIGLDLNISVAKKIVDSSKINVVEITEQTNIEKFSNVDIITSFDVLEHVNDLEKIAKSFYNILNDNGILVVSGPTENLFYKIARQVAKIMINGNLKGGEEHVTNIINIRNEIEKNGFKITQFKNLFGLFHIIKFEK